MVYAGGSIEAVLKLNASNFNEGIKSSTQAVDSFKASINSLDGAKLERALTTLSTQLPKTISEVNKLNESIGNIKNFDTLSLALSRITKALVELSSDSMNAERGINILNTVFEQFTNVARSTNVTLEITPKILNQISGASRQAESSLKQMQRDLLNLGNSAQGLARIQEQARMMRAEFERSRSELMNFARYGVQAFNQLNAQSDAYKKQLASMNVEFERSRAELMEFARYGRSQFGTITAGVQQYEKALEVALPTQRQMITNNIELARTEEQVSSATQRGSANWQRYTASTNASTKATMNQTSATRKLYMALSSIRTIGFLASTMLVYNFASSLVTATRETINAKSEMNGYFQMLGYTKRQVADFNAELDKTVKKFPRLNKYALGETISSIGVEFELTTAEMKKAMPVVSMITSEYLRAGRNVNEASLAVKDILQGEFQRLSRETGVKGDQLKATGLWSGDKTDVMGLLKALEKVGKDRNWDVFVTKANSLNDAVLILQNRFSEWSADMVERVQPTIVSVFNMMMGTAQKFAGVINGISNWLMGDSIESQVTKWGLLASAIGTVVTALISYRTGANLLQIAQMGLSKSILSTIFGLKAETVSYYGVKTAIYSKIFGLNAEKVAEFSVKDAILSKVLGLNAEIVAQKGLKAGILESAFAREIEALRLKGATAEEVLNTIALYENNLAKKSSIGLLSAMALQLNMTTYAEHGFLVALLEAKSGMDASRIASMKLTGKIALLGTSLIIPTAIVGAFAIALGTLALQMRDSAKQMEKFNKLVNDGQEIIKDNKAIVDDYTKRQENLSKTLQETERGTVEYYNAQKELMSVNDSLIVATKNYENSVKAVEVAVSSQKHYEERLTEISIEKQGRLAEAYMDAGYSMREAYEMANDSLIDANNGAEQLRITLQKIAQLSYKGEQNTAYLLKQFEENNVDKDVGKKYLTETERLNQMAIDGMEKGLTDESFMGRMDGWFSYYEAQVRKWINNVGAMTETGDWGAIWENIWKGIAHGFADLPIIKDFWGWVYDQLGVNKYKGQGWDAFGDIFNDAINGLFGSIFGTNDDNSLQAQFGKWMSDSVNSIDVMGFLNDLFVKPFQDIDLSEIGNNFIENIKKELFKPPSEDGQENLDLLNSLFGGFIEFIRNGGIGQWIQEQVGDWNLVDAFIDAFSNNESSDSGSGSGIAKKITADNLLTNLIDLSGIGTFVDEHIVRPFWNWLYQQLGLPLGQKVSVTQLIESIIEVSGDAIATWVSDNIINPLKDSVTQGILDTPVLGDVASFLGLGEEPKAEAEVEGQAIGTSFNTGIQTGLAPVDGIINNAFKGLNLDAITSNFTSNTSTMVTNATSTATSVATSFTTMKNNHKSSVDSMVNNNTTAFRDMHTKSNTQMLAMRDSTSNVTSQMTDAWALMRDSIIASATKIKNDSKSRFDTLGQTIGGFYKKIQNPSLWGGGAGSGSTPRRVARNPSVGKALVRGVRTRGGYAGGLDSKPTNATMSIAQLKKQLCPNGECADIFNGYNMDDTVNVWDFLQSIGGKHGLGGWNFAEPHNTYIKNKSDAWGTAPPIIQLLGGINTSTGFKVGEFNNGTPTVSFSTFEQIATAIFSSIPYRFYFDSSWKGSWLGALQSGACNCYDGALALMALASTFGFSTGMGHGTWTDPSGKKTAHVWAIINGVKMDTTGMQQRGSWRPSASAGGNPTGSSDRKVVNVTVDMQGATIYGVDDLDSRIQESVSKGLQAEFNDPYTMAI